MYVYIYIIYIYIYMYIYIARASNNLESFSRAVKPFIARMSRQVVSIEKINSFILNLFSKHHSDFNNICQSKHELLI